MRLAIVNQFYVPDISPTAHLAASLAEHRAAIGDQVTVVCGSGTYTPGPGADSVERRSNPALHRIWTPSLGKRSAIRRILDYGTFFVQAAWTLLTLPGQDVVVLMTTPPYIGLTGILHRLIHRRTRLVLWSMDCYPETLERAGLLRRGDLASRILRGLNLWLFRKLDCVVCLDEAMRLMLREAYAALGHAKWAVIPNWEAAAMFPPGFKPPAWEGVARLGLQGIQVVLYLGNAGAGHRFETVLEAAARLPASDHAFVFIGGGSAWPGLEAAQRTGRLANAILEGYVPKADTPRILGAADAALITLRDEMLGVMSPSKMHAALAMGLPIVYIGPRGGNVHEAIERFGCGISLRHGDSDGLVRFLERLRLEPALREDLSRRARLAFETAYSDRIGLARFDALLDGQRPRS
jgi:colanic acid biosynthesis glycosyl transferase WcaI